VIPSHSLGAIETHEAYSLERVVERGFGDEVAGVEEGVDSWDERDSMEEGSAGDVLATCWDLR
jgi:hypothetical protein